MMEFNHCYFHNVAELEEVPGMPGWRLQRFPEKVRHCLSSKGRSKAVQSNGCEIRFVTDSDRVRLTLSAWDEGGSVLIFKGDYFHSKADVKGGRMQTIELEDPERFLGVKPEILSSGSFSPDVWRVYFDRFNAVFHALETFGHDVRPPRPGEMPDLNMLVYGSSITQGAGAMHHYTGYTQRAARRLSLDVVNLALSGSCYCEPELADHIAEKKDWDLIFLEIGVNMRGRFPIDVIRARSAYLLDRILEKHPAKPVFLTTIYPNRATFAADEQEPFTVEEKKTNDWLRQYARDKNHAHLHLLEGGRILTEFSGLTSDLIHPSDDGHILMGERLAGFLAPGVSRLREERRQAREGR